MSDFAFWKKRKKEQKIDEKNDGKLELNIPKTLTGFLLVGGGLAAKSIGIPEGVADWIIAAGLTMAAAGIGCKLERVSRGKSAWKNEIALLSKLIGKGK